MEHSTCVLDISDDEGKSQSSRDGRGKENIPPQESTLQGEQLTATSRKDMMTDETRTPLGELNPKDFCPAGLDVTSCVVYEEDGKSPSKEEVPQPAPEPADAAPATTTEPSLLATATVSALIQSTAPAVEAEQQKQQQPATDAADVPLPAVSEIEIWESGSAAEAAATASDPVESILSP